MTAVPTTWPCALLAHTRLGRTVHTEEWGADNHLTENEAWFRRG